ncbi:MAG: YCF48-related protein [Planctomycetaceae bacterium]
MFRETFSGESNTATVMEDRSMVSDQQVATRCFSRTGRLRAATSLICVLLSIAARADEPALNRPGLTRAAEVVDTSAATPRRAGAPTPEQDDATLHAVDFVGTQLGVAVGDRGTVWRTDDGGRTWSFVPVPTQLSLRSVCLLTDRVGWIAGGGVDVAKGISTGGVLTTRDGGASWSLLDTPTLPPLHDIQFFDLQQGCAVGIASPRAPTAVYVTEDGGTTWEVVPGTTAGRWTAGAFLDRKHGAVVGPRGQQGTFGNGRLLPLRSRESLRGIHDVTLRGDGVGWVVGDGGYLRRSDDAGISWPEPPGAPPFEVSRWQDFRAVSTVGNRVWVAGSPGSVVWHSFDGGLTWLPQRTGDAAPIHAIDFPSETTGCAVGAFGAIRMTRDGGRTWESVRAGGRRPALLTIQPHLRDASPLMLTLYAGEQGFRAVTSTVVRDDAGVDGAAGGDARDRQRAMVLAAGANEVEVTWRLPETLPDLSRDPARLISEWSKVTEQRLNDVLLGGLVLSIRMWRPEVIVCPASPEDDALAALLTEAIPHAVRQAGDPAFYPEHATLLSLEPWRVSKVFVRTTGREAGLTINPDQILPRQETFLRHAAARTIVSGDDTTATATAESYRLMPTGGVTAAAGSMDAWGRGLLSGLHLAPGGDARRALPAINEFDEESLVRLAQQQRNFARYTEQMLDDPRHAGQVIAQLRRTTADLPPDEAARLLSDLADQYRARSQWEYVVQTLIELAEQYPTQPEAQQAMKWLLAYSTSREMLWQDLRTKQAQSPEMLLDRTILQTNFEQASRAVTEAENSAQAATRIGDLPSPITHQQHSASVRMGDLQAMLRVGENNVRGSPVPAGTDQAANEINQRLRLAGNSAVALKRFAPRVYDSADAQFVLAAWLRSANEAAAATEIYRDFFGADDGIDPWHQTARGELWIGTRGALSPKPVLRCAKISSKPLLDGVLSDECWRGTTPITLTDAQASKATIDPTFVGSQRLGDVPEGTNTVSRPVTTGAIVRLAYDHEYLYIAAEMPAVSGGNPTPVTMKGRTHDADLRSFDRLRWTFDIDRDYATWYQFEVDQRGATREAVWEDQRWNPHWHVAANANSTGWSVEAAIPWEELTPVPPRHGDVWAGGVTRIDPNSGVTAWTHPAALTVQGETFGLIQFD